MPSKNLTARFVESVSVEKRTDFWDSHVRGLVLRVTPSGAKTWSAWYRHRRRQRRLTIGPTDAYSLAEARDAAREAIRTVRRGTDPALAKQETQETPTVEKLANDFLEQWSKPRKRSWRQDKNLLTNKVFPKWRHRLVSEITRRDVLTLVNSIADAGAPISANRTAALLSKLFRWAVDHDRLETNPATHIPRPGLEHARDRVLTADELRAFWEALEAQPAPMAAFWKLRALTAQSGGEISRMRWTDVDLEAGWWTIPAEHAKNKLAHRVPLSTSSVSTIAELLATAGKDDVYVLAGARGKHQRGKASQTFSIDGFHGHDLRRTAASMMTGGGIARSTVAKILNHQEPGVTKVYDRFSYDPEKCAALEWWTQKLQAILENGDAGKVLAFSRG